MSSFSNQTKNESSFSSDVDFLLKQDSFFLLLEDGCLIIIKGGGGEEKNTSVYTLQTKN